MSNNQLHHAGVKGMKWGVRKDRSKGTNAPSKGGKKTRTTTANPKTARKKSASSRLRSMASKTLKAATAGLNTAVAIQADVEIAKSSYKLINSVPNKDRGYVAAAIYATEYRKNGG